jgi:hypothetical protein
VIPDTEHYKYLIPYIAAAQPLGASKNGKNKTTIEALQDLAVEGYRTALALTTEPDLTFYFANYKHRFGNSNILFITAVAPCVWISMMSVPVKDAGAAK